MSTFKYKSKMVRHQFKLIKMSIVNKGVLEDPLQLYFSDHLCDRIIERKLEHEVDFVGAIVENFIVNVFNKTTYVDRKYCVQFKNLKVGINVSLGKHGGIRYAGVTTAFTSDVDYKCDEKIILK
jgi:hypothetical protein